jgi:hypothetical protein
VNGGSSPAVYDGAVLNNLNLATMSAGAATYVGGPVLDGKIMRPTFRTHSTRWPDLSSLLRNSLLA